MSTHTVESVVVEVANLPEFAAAAAAWDAASAAGWAPEQSAAEHSASSSLRAAIDGILRRLGVEDIPVLIKLAQSVSRHGLGIHGGDISRPAQRRLEALGGWPAYEAGAIEANKRVAEALDATGGAFRPPEEICVVQRARQRAAARPHVNDMTVGPEPIGKGMSPRECALMAHSLRSEMLRRPYDRTGQAAGLILAYANAALAGITPRGN